MREIIEGVKREVGRGVADPPNASFGLLGVQFLAVDGVPVMLPPPPPGPKVPLREGS